MSVKKPIRVLSFCANGFMNLPEPEDAKWPWRITSRPVETLSKNVTSGLCLGTPQWNPLNNNADRFGDGVRYLVFHSIQNVRAREGRWAPLQAPTDPEKSGEPLVVSYYNFLNCILFWAFDVGRRYADNELKVEQFAGASIDGIPITEDDVRESFVAEKFSQIITEDAIVFGVVNSALWVKLVALDTFSYPDPEIPEVLERCTSFCGGYHIKVFAAKVSDKPKATNTNDAS